MTDLNQTALAAAKEVRGIASTEGIIRAYLDALPAAPLPEEVERVRERLLTRATNMNGAMKSRGLYLRLGDYADEDAALDRDAAALLTQQAQALADAKAERGVFLREAGAHFAKSCELADRALTAEARIAEMEQEHQEFRLQNDREWQAKVDHAKARVADANARLPRLTDDMMRAAARAHFASDNIDGIGMTANGIDYSFRQAFTRMWSGIRRARGVNND